MKQKKLFYLLLVLIFSGIMMQGCGKREQKGKITLTIVKSHSVDVESQIFDKSLNRFMAENPDINIKKILFPAQKYWTKLMTMIAGGNPPDIFRGKPDHVPTLIQKGVLMPLDSFVEKSKVVNLEDFFSQTLWQYRLDLKTKTIGKGPIYGFGTDWSPCDTMFFNKDMFDEAGIEYPTKSLSWEEFRDIAKKLTMRKGNKKQFGCLIANWQSIALVYQNEGKAFSEDMKRCLLDSPEAIEAFQFLVDLKIKDKVMPAFSELRETGRLQLFQTGRLGMFFSGRYYVPAVEKRVKNRIRWGVAPGLHRKKRVNTFPGCFGWVMSKKTRYPEQAWKLMEHLVAGEYVTELAKAGFNIPAIKKIAYSDLFLTNPEHPEGFNKIFMDEVKYSVSEPTIPYCPKNRWLHIFDEELDLAVLGKQTAEESARKATRKVNEIIKENLDSDK